MNEKTGGKIRFELLVVHNFRVYAQENDAKEFHYRD